MENVRKHRDIKLVTTDERRNKLVSEQNYHKIINSFKKYAKPKSKEEKQEKEIVLKNFYNFFGGREKILDAFESKI